MDDSLSAAIGYMLPEGQEASRAIIALQTRVDSEASAATQAVICSWQGSTPLKEGFGELIATTTRVGKWAEWTIGRRLGTDLWPILHWEEIPYAD